MFVEPGGRGLIPRRRGMTVHAVGRPFGVGERPVCAAGNRPIISLPLARSLPSVQPFVSRRSSLSSRLPSPTSPLDPRHPRHREPLSLSAAMLYPSMRAAP